MPTLHSVTPVPFPAPLPYGGSSGASTSPAMDLATRRPSPWHDIAHSLSTASLPPSRSRRSSTPSSAAAATPPFTPVAVDSDSEVPSQPLSSQALRTWDRLLATPDNDVTRHALVPGSPLLAPTLDGSTGAPKLAAERDKEGHIEYKLKLIEPSPERFERLVTQMMWRLKQGRNEAIYELGLADDGTVIGLTRAEMDASLSTLERMASEVGATVLVLKEIVLAAPPPNPDDPLSASQSSSASGSPWVVRRPDLDEFGRPRKGTKGINGAGPDVKTRKERAKARIEAASEPHSSNSKPKQIIFDDDGTDSDHSGRERSASNASEEDPPAFQLDMEPRVSAPLTAADAARGEAKRRKSAQRREQRRLDLLRGDGTMPFVGADRSSSAVAEFIGNAPAGPRGAAATAARLAHQPARPSSLRLGTGPRAEPSTSPLSSSGTALAPDDAFLHGLNLPLDSLSLSFADVRVDDSAAPTAACSPEASAGAWPVPGARVEPAVELTGEEMICVEALVVRKAASEWELDGFGDGTDGDEEWEEGDGEDEGWGF